MPLRRDVIREPDLVLALRRRNQMADPLILITPGQQLPPEFFIHTVIPPERALYRKGTGGRTVTWTPNAPGAA
jgi:hypothetical protein